MPNRKEQRGSNRAAQPKSNHFSSGPKSGAARQRKAPIYRLPSDSFRTTLIWTGTYDTLYTTFQEQNYGVSDPGARVPKYWKQYFGIYKYAVIEAIKITFDVMSIDLRPARLVLAETNTADVAPTSFLELSETPRAYQGLVAQGGNTQVVKFSRQTSARAILGHKLEDDESFWCTETSGPTAPVQPLISFGVEPIVSGATSQLYTNVKIYYSIKFFTLNHL